MRNQLIRGHSTKAERRFAELLKRARIPFKVKVMIGGREVDFLVGKYAIEINGHAQDTDKNVMLMNEGYIPVHLWNHEVLTDNVQKYAG
jgi:very-short-patch-repair endonuclease